MTYALNFSLQVYVELSELPRRGTVNHSHPLITRTSQKIAGNSLLVHSFDSYNLESGHQRLTHDQSTKTISQYKEIRSQYLCGCCVCLCVRARTHVSVLCHACTCLPTVLTRALAVHDGKDLLINKSLQATMKEWNVPWMQVCVDYSRLLCSIHYFKTLQWMHSFIHSVLVQSVSSVSKRGIFWESLELLRASWPPIFEINICLRG